MLRRFGTALTNVSMHLQPRGCRPAQYTPPSRSQERCKAGHMFGVHGQPTSTERRARTTTVAILAAAHIGTSGVLASCKHAGRWAAWATPRIVRGHPVVLS